MSTITREWLQKAIKQHESMRNEIPFGLDEDDSNTLAALHIALASLEAEAVAYIIQDAQARGLGRPGFLSFDASISDEDINEYEISVTPLYTAPQLPQPAVPDMATVETTYPDVQTNWQDAKMYAEGWNACRAAMLQGAEPVTTTYKSPDDFICMLTGRAKYLREKGEFKSPELLERAAAALQEESVNTPPIPNGWKLVPIDPTKDMLRAGQSVVGFWLNTVHCYSKMLAAAPAAPQQEVK